MHTLELYKDILHLVLREISDPYTGRFPILDREAKQTQCQSRRQLFSLALVSKSFSALALEFLWEKLDSLVPLVKTLPPQLWYLQEPKENKQTKTLFLTGLPRYEDWARARFYARYVRIYFDDELLPVTVTVHPNIINHLSLVPFRLTRLLHLRVTLLPFVDFRVFVISPNLRSLSCAITNFFPDTALDERLGLEYLLWDHNDQGQHCGQTEVSKLICKSPKLRNVTVSASALTDRTLRFLGQIQLRCLDVQVSAQAVGLDTGFASDYPELNFPYLSELIITCDNLGSTLPFMRRSTFKQLENFGINVTRHFTAPEFSLLVLSLSDRAPGCIQYLTITFIDGLEPTLSHISLMPLLKLTELQRLELCIPSDASDDFLLHLSRAFPHLEYLDIEFKDMERGTNFTTRGLIYLVEGCSRLRELCICFTGDIEGLPSWNGVGNLLVTNINVLTSTITPNDVSPMASLLHKLFPRLDSIDHFWDADSDIEGREWTRCEQIIRAESSMMPR